MIALNSTTQKNKLRMYDGLIKLNQRAKNMDAKSVTVLIRFCFSKILFIYAYGPFHWASPVIAAITAIVNIHTNLPGLVIIVKMFTRETNNKSAQIPKEMKAFDIIFSAGKWEKSLPRNPEGGAAGAGASDLLKKESTPPDF